MGHLARLLLAMGGLSPSRWHCRGWGHRSPLIIWATMSVSGRLCCQNQVKTLQTVSGQTRTDTTVLRICTHTP